MLLALSVFLSIVGGMLPRSSKSMPEVTMYLFILLIISMLTVLDSIAIVCLHHMEEVGQPRSRNISYKKTKVKLVKKKLCQLTLSFLNILNFSGGLKYILSYLADWNALRTVVP